MKFKRLFFLSSLIAAIGFLFSNVKANLPGYNTIFYRCGTGNSIIEGIWCKRIRIPEEFHTKKIPENSQLFKKLKELDDVYEEKQFQLCALSEKLTKTYKLDTSNPDVPFLILAETTESFYTNPKAQEDMKKYRKLCHELEVIAATMSKLIIDSRNQIVAA